MNKWEELDKKYIWHPFTQMKGWLENPQLVIDHGEGVKLYDTEGKEYLDAISSLLFRYLPKSIAEKVTSLSPKKLSLIAAGLVAFAGLNILFKAIPLMILLAAGYVFGFHIDAPKIFSVCGVVCAALVFFLIAPVLGGGLLFVMWAAPIVKYRRKIYIVAAVVSLDIFIGALTGSELGIFLFLVELITVMVVYRKKIADFVLDYIEYGTLGPIDKVTEKIPRRRKSGADNNNTADDE